ncbi:MAG: RNA polymerase sigma factor [Thermoleophilaceae bacterium]
MEARIDDRVLDDLRRGTGGARARLYLSFRMRVFAYLSGMVLDTNTVWDLTHDVFEKAFEAAARFDGEPAALTPWLMVIAHNTALDFLRSARRAQAEEPAEIERRRERDAPEHRPEWGDHDEVHRALAALPPQQREVLLQRYRDDRAAAEIGRTLGKSADAVRHIEQRALDSVRRRVRGGMPQSAA